LLFLQNFKDGLKKQNYYSPMLFKNFSTTSSEYQRPFWIILSSIGETSPINPRAFAVFKIERVRMTGRSKCAAIWYPMFSSIITTSAFSSLAKTMTSDSPLSRSFSRNCTRSLFWTEMTSTQSLSLKSDPGFSRALNSISTAFGITMCWKRTCRINSCETEFKLMIGVDPIVA